MPSVTYESESTGPGFTQFTVNPRGANSYAIVFVMPASAAFDAPYAISPGSGPKSCPEVINTIRPESLGSRTCATAAASMILERVFTAQWWSRSAAVIASNDPSEPDIAWLATSTSTCSNSRIPAPTTASGASGWEKSALTCTNLRPGARQERSSETTRSMSSLPHGWSASCGTQC